MLKNTSSVEVELNEIVSPKISLLNLPPEILEKIAQNATSNTLVAMSGTCKRLHTQFQPELEKRAAKQLMEYVLYPTAENILKAKKMYEANPRLLFIKTQGHEQASGVDANGQAVHRKILDSSPFQAALGTGDSALYNHMATCFYKVEDGVARAQQQIQEKFPNGFDYPPSDYDFTALVAAITNDPALIDNSNPSDATKALLAQFRKDFLPSDVTQGHHFNLNHLIKAFEVYNQQFDSWNWNQRSLFWCQVIGYIERLVPVVDAQAFCQGLYYLLEENQPQTRSLSLYNYQSSSEITYYDDGLGFDFGIGIYGWREGVGPREMA